MVSKHNKSPMGNGKTMITIYGDQYWIGNRAKLISSGLKGGACLHRNNLYSVFFYDYHRNTDTKDIRLKYLDNFACFSKSPAQNATNYHFAVEQKSVARKAISDYLNEFVNYSTSENIINCIENYCRKTPNDCDPLKIVMENMRQGFGMDEWRPPSATPDQLSQSELVEHDVVIGNPFFNKLFYPTAVQVIKEIAPINYTQKIYNAFVKNIEDHGFSIHDYTNRENILVTLFDECKEYVFHCTLEDGEFSVHENCNARDFRWSPGYRCYLCSESDYEKYIEKIIIFISNWSLVLSTYMSMCIFGSLGLTVCY